MQKQEAYLSEKTRFEICGCVWKNCGCSTGTWKCLLQVISKFQKQFNPSCAFKKFLFSQLLCGASKGFMKTFRAFIKPFEASLRSVKIKI